jgi:hypothetical protein
MQFDNATNLDRKSGVPGTIMIGFQCFPRRAQPRLIPLSQKQWWGFPPLLSPHHGAIWTAADQQSNLISFGQAPLKGSSKLHHPTSRSIR